MGNKGKSKNPAYPDAHPTAPGGMSQKALVRELVDKHGWDEGEAKGMKWPEQISAVVQGRLDREAEAKREAESVEVAPLYEPEPDTLNYRFNGHWGAGPSASERWLTCTASLGASRRFLETLTVNQQREFSVASEAARQGTTAHRVGEVKALSLLGKMEQSAVDAELMELSILPLDGEEYTDEMEDYTNQYVDLIKQLHDEDREVLIETRVSAAVPLSGLWEDEVYEIVGSADAIALPTKKHKSLVVADLKYGNGIDVEVEENSQARIYALGALDLLTDDDGDLTVPVKTVEYYIVQPRLSGIKQWSESLDDLLDWRDDVLSPALTKALYGVDEAGATYEPSPVACQFCQARGTCSALAEAQMDRAAELFDVIVETEFAEGSGAIPETGSLSNERIGALLAQADGLVKLRDSLKEEVSRRLYRGAEIPGYQLVCYTPPRKWTEGAIEELREHFPELFIEKIVTPKQGLAILKANNPDDEGAMDDLLSFIETQPIKPVVGTTDDRRKPWQGMAPESMFDIEEGD